MKRRLAFLVLASSGIFALASADAPRVVTLVPPSIVDIPRTSYLRGSDVRSLDAAIRMCREHSDGFASQACLPDAFAIEHPQREISVSAFRIDRTEVTQEAYGRCVSTGRCRAPRGVPADPAYAGPTLPVVGVAYADAARYCAFLGGRLPTEAEWECAARGRASPYFPWGDAWDGRLANHGRAGRRVDGSDGHRALAPVGSYPDGSSASGLADVAGNAAEWVFDPFVADAYEHTGAIDPVATGGSGLRIARGGSFLAMPHDLRAASRRIEPEDRPAVDIGFRCAYAASPVRSERGAVDGGVPGSP